MGADTTALAKIVIDYILIIYDAYGIIRAYFLADRTLFALLLVDDRPLIPPVAGFVI
jgi:hypothetical protein